MVLSSLLLQNVGKKGSQLWRGKHDGCALSLCFSLRMGHRVTLPHCCTVLISRVVLRNRKHHPRAKLSGLSPCSLSLTLQPGQSPQGMVAGSSPLETPRPLLLQRATASTVLGGVQEVLGSAVEASGSMPSTAQRLSQQRNN